MNETMGNIGADPREIEFEPLTAPSVPEPVTVPEPAPELVPAGACTPWSGPLDQDGYGRIRVDGVQRRAHRVLYERVHGKIPEPLTIDHLCHNSDRTCPGGVACPHRACVNLDHLEPATRRANTLRGVGPTALNARKTECVNGHEFTEDNTHVAADGRRSCRACWRVRSAAYKARKASAA